MNTALAFLGGCITALTLRFIFRVFLEKPADATRDAYLLQRSDSRRRFFIRAFVEAVQGKGKSDDSFAIAALWRFFPVCFIFTGLLMLNGFDDEQLVKNRRSIEAILEVIRNPASNAASPSLIERELEGERLLANLEQTRAMLVRNWWIGAFAIVVGIACWIWLSAYRLPLVETRSRIAHQLERFTLRIQALATDEELVELIRKESAVWNEQTAKEYVNAMVKIARRYDVESLVYSFMPWEPPPVSVLPPHVIPAPQSQPAQSALPQPAAPSA
jgi:hypothetical protein